MSKECQLEGGGRKITNIDDTLNMSKTFGNLLANYKMI